MNDVQLTLLRELQKENKWWTTGTVPAELKRTFKRADFYIYSQLITKEDYANVIIGPRRIGKSTVLYQLIDYLITEKKISPNRIIFLSLERPFFDTIKDPIPQALQLFEENILKEPIESLKEHIYIFLDEASRSEDWALQVKEFFDRKYKTRFFVTGSSSPALFSKSAESLVGRHNKIIMLTLKFTDVVKIVDEKNEIPFLAKINKFLLRTFFLEAVKVSS